MKILPKQYALSLYESLADKSESEVEAIIKKFVVILANNRQLKKMEEIISHFQDIWQKEKGELIAGVSSAKKLETEAKMAVVDYLKKKSQATNVILEEAIDEKILGGFILRYDNKIIDGSLKNNLDELRRKLKS